MDGWIVAASLCVLLSQAAGPGQAPAGGDALKAFSAGVGTYVEAHRRLEGPVPTLQASRDMDEVLRLMARLRSGLRAAQPLRAEGTVFTPDVTSLFREWIASVLTRKDLLDIVEDIEEHSPPEGLPPLKIYEPLPEEAPFISIPPRLLSKLPPLPPELRYVVLGKALVLWDHHANMVVDLAPGLFDPATYKPSDDLR